MLEPLRPPPPPPPPPGNTRAVSRAESIPRLSPHPSPPPPLLLSFSSCAAAVLRVRFPILMHPRRIHIPHSCCFVLGKYFLARAYNSPVCSRQRVFAYAQTRYSFLVRARAPPRIGILRITAIAIYPRRHECAILFIYTLFVYRADS